MIVFLEQQFVLYMSLKFLSIPTVCNKILIFTLNLFNDKKKKLKKTENKKKNSRCDFCGAAAKNTKENVCRWEKPMRNLLQIPFNDSGKFLWH